MAIDFDLTPAQPFRITLPTTATVNDAGEVVVDLTANASQAEADAAAAQATADAAQVDATQALADAATAQATADAAVANADTQPMGPVVVSLAAAATGTTYSWRPGFAGTLVSASLVLDGASIGLGSAASVALSIAGAAVTTSVALSAPSLSAAGFAVSATVTAPTGAFTANQVIKITTTSDSASATAAGVMLGYTRA